MSAEYVLPVQYTIYSFTQTFIESFPVLFQSCQMYNFHVVSANFLCFVQIIQLTSSQQMEASIFIEFPFSHWFTVPCDDNLFISSLDHFTTFELSTFKYQ